MGNHRELPEIVGKSIDIDRILAGMDGKSPEIIGKSLFIAENQHEAKGITANHLKSMGNQPGSTFRKSPQR
jgi:hypothetical protein